MQPYLLLFLAKRVLELHTVSNTSIVVAGRRLLPLAYSAIYNLSLAFVYEANHERME